MSEETDQKRLDLAVNSLIEQAKWLGVVIDKQTLLNEIKGESSDDNDDGDGSDKAEKDFWAANDAGIQAKKNAEEAANGWTSVIDKINWYYSESQRIGSSSVFRKFVTEFQD